MRRIKSREGLQNGFSLIELIVAMGIFAIAGTIVMSILFSSIRGASKTNLLTKVRQSGNYALEQIAKTIRTAQRYDGMSNTSSFDPVCDEAVQYSRVQVKLFDENDPVIFQCSAGGIPQRVQGSSSQDLVNPDTVSGVVGSCYFKCSGTDPVTIGINFSLTHQTATPQPLENQVRINYNTTVTMRNTN